jgi:hypothetical protein
MKAYWSLFFTKFILLYFCLYNGSKPQSSNHLAALVLRYNAPKFSIIASFYDSPTNWRTLSTA